MPHHFILSRCLLYLSSPYPASLLLPLALPRRQKTARDDEAPPAEIIAPGGRPFTCGPGLLDGMIIIPAAIQGTCRDAGTGARNRVRRRRRNDEKGMKEEEMKAEDI